MSNRKTKYLTLKQAVQLVRDEDGIPITASRVHKDNHLGCGPTPAGRYGPGFLYTAEGFRRYAQGRVKKIEPVE